MVGSEADGDSNTYKAVESLVIDDDALPEPTWQNMPHKSQVAILALSRFVDFFQQAAIQTYGYYQLKSFDATISEAELTRQTGILFAAFTFSQIVSSFVWGVAADRRTIGRKLVLQVGLIGTAFGCIGMAFAASFGQAVSWRFFCGAVNGTVGSARSMLGERVPKQWHSRAFLLFPAAFNIANVFGPLLSGMLTEHSHKKAGPGLLHSNVLFMRYPYAVPNLLCAFMLLSEAVLVQLHLKETLKDKRPFNMLSILPTWLIKRMSSGTTSHVRSASFEQELLLSGSNSASRPPLSKIWNADVFWVLVSIAIFDFHLGAFNNLWVLMLTAAREYLSIHDSIVLGRRSLFKFSSGLAFTPSGVGKALATIGYIGVILQFLLYPPASKRFGLLRCFRVSIFLFPVAYYVAPFIAQIPSTSPPPEPATGTAIWIGIAFVVLLQVTGRTFAMPAVIILLNNASPHPSLLGTVNGLGQTCSATFRTIGPYASSAWFTTWRERGVIGMAWWLLACVAATGCVASFWLKDGDPGQKTNRPLRSVETDDGENNK